MRLIHELESGPRGVYCGAVGVVRPGIAAGRVHATFNVPIRTVVARGTQLRCGIGSGITSGAEAPAEWQEWRHKRAFLDKVGKGVQPWRIRASISTFWKPWPCGGAGFSTFEAH